MSHILRTGITPAALAAAVQAASTAAPPAPAAAVSSHTDSAGGGQGEPTRTRPGPAWLMSAASLFQLPRPRGEPALALRPQEASPALQKFCDLFCG